MKKLFFLGSCLFLYTQSPAADSLTKIKTHTQVKRDQQFSCVYYNTQKFPQGLFNAQGTTLIPQEHITNALIAWDINGVLFKKEYSIPSLMYRLAVTEKYGWIFTLKAFASFTNLMRYKKQLKQKHDPRGWVFDAMFQELETSEKGKKYAPLLRKFTTQANHLNYTSVTLLQDLEAAGHTNALLSNMGQGLVDVLINSLATKATKKTTEPKRVESFSPEKIKALHCAIEFLSDSKRHVIASPANNWLHKPLKKSYQTCLNKNRSSKKQIKIILDDKLSNITAGLRDGLFDIGILFTNATEVRTVFKQLHLTKNHA